MKEGRKERQKEREGEGEREREREKFRNLIGSCKMATGRNNSSVTCGPESLLAFLYPFYDRDEVQ